MRRRLHPLIAVLCALFFLGAQQVAHAHFLGHLGLAAETTVKQGDDADHGAAGTLSNVCTTCAAFAALDSAPPLAALAPRVVAVVAISLPQPRPAPGLAQTAPPYAPRAPPAVL